MGASQLSADLDQYFPGAFLAQMAHVKQVAQWYSRKFNGSLPEFTMPTDVLLKTYISINRYTRIHVDGSDLGYNFQTYFGTTKEEASCTIPSLGFAAVHPEGGGCGNVLFGRNLLHGSFKSSSDLRMLGAGFTPPCSEACSKPDYRVSTKHKEGDK